MLIGLPCIAGTAGNRRGSRSSHTSESGSVEFSLSLGSGSAPDQLTPPTSAGWLIGSISIDGSADSYADDGLATRLQQRPREFVAVP